MKKDESISQSPLWQYDEMKQIGKDYCSFVEVEAYDARHGKFRNVEQENEKILDLVDLRPDHVVIELGTGTGAFAVQAAGRCQTVYAVDISPVMLAYAKEKADAKGAGNIVFCHGGFLTYFHAGPRADVMVTSMAFHHLPDFWKGVALSRLNNMLKAGGMLYLADVIFDAYNLNENIERWIARLEKVGGPDFRKDMERHIRMEYSTYDWIIDGLLTRAGFRIQDKEMEQGVIGRYVCIKEERQVES